MKKSSLSPSSYHALFKHGMECWQLYCASAETIMHRTMMMQKKPATHPEFLRMITEKQNAYAEGMMAWAAQWQQQSMQWIMRPTLQPNMDYLLKNQLKLYDAFMGSAEKTAKANARRLRKQI
jgi:hypothetical protein